MTDTGASAKARGVTTGGSVREGLTPRLITRIRTLWPAVQTGIVGAP